MKDARKRSKMITAALAVAIAIAAVLVAQRPTPPESAEPCEPEPNPPCYAETVYVSALQPLLNSAYPSTTSPKQAFKWQEQYAEAAKTLRDCLAETP